MKLSGVKDRIQTGVGLLSKAFQILDLFQPETPSWTQSDIVRATGLNRSTANRLVRYLARTGYLIQIGATGQYRLGLASLDLGRRARSSFDLHDVCRPILERLSRETEESVLLTAFDETNLTAVCVDQIESRRDGILVFARIGAMFPLHAGAAPKAILAALPQAAQEDYFSRDLEKISERTIVDPDKLRADMELTGERGYSVSFQETYDGTAGIGAAIRGPDGKPLGSMAIALPIQRINEEKIETYGRMLVKAVHDISEILNVANTGLPGSGTSE
ncbi:MAG: IclR family transcriptional regulator [Fimbriimonadaceae bacterium]|nr:IclR family transcriptional regulator [Alphaproteobacteria bacterium]